MSKLTGTNYFVDMKAALRYYAQYGFTYAAVFDKRARGEIHTGVPPVKPGESLELNRREGRYFIRSDGASARLIAAAPRMLAALKSLQVSVDVGAYDFELSEEIKAVITEVDGK